MRNFVLALALAFAGGSVAFADGIPTAADAQNQPKNPWTVTVYNDDTITINSGEIVAWDVADTDLSSSRRPYVISTSTIDDVWTAGVMLNTCGPGEQCEMVVYGPAWVRCADLHDAVGADTSVGVSNLFGVGLCGDYTPGANKRSLGTAIGAGNGTDYSYQLIWVNTIGAMTEQ